MVIVFIQSQKIRRLQNTWKIMGFCVDQSLRQLLRTSHMKVSYRMYHCNLNNTNNTWKKLTIFPTCRAKLNIDLLSQMENETIWEDSFWTFQDTILECLTLNSPITYSKSQDDIMVRTTSHLTMKTSNPKVFTHRLQLSLTWGK